MSFVEFEPLHLTPASYESLRTTLEDESEPLEERRAAVGMAIAAKLPLGVDTVMLDEVGAQLACPEIVDVVIKAQQLLLKEALNIILPAALHEAIEADLVAQAAHRRRYEEEKRLEISSSQS
jgi:hypothetical protein